MVCLPLSDPEAPLERLAGWRLVFFVILEFTLCVIFSAHPPPDTPQLRPTPRIPRASESIEPREYTYVLPQYRQSNWVQDLLPTLKSKAFEEDGGEWESQVELYNILEAEIKSRAVHRAPSSFPHSNF